MYTYRGFLYEDYTLYIWLEKKTLASEHWLKEKY